ncbi:WG repeat-containing protein [Candidatus Dependentiae bacterium]|nr:WG repeat-containing protein [Candidatus Dependentiae bacterium]
MKKLLFCSICILFLSIVGFTSSINNSKVTSQNKDKINEIDKNESNTVYQLLPIQGNNGKYGFINKQDKIVIPCKFDGAGHFSEGLAMVELKGKYGYINKQGKIVISCKFDEAGPFSEGLARVKLNGKDNYIDKNGKLLVPLLNKE